MTALPSSPRPLSEPHPHLALEKNNLRADAQPTRDDHEHRRRIPIIAIDGQPALACSISTAQPNAGDTYRSTDKTTFILPSQFPEYTNPRHGKPKLTVETQTDKPAIDLKAALALPAVTSAPA